MLLLLDACGWFVDLLALRWWLFDLFESSVCGAVYVTFATMLLWVLVVCLLLRLGVWFSEVWVGFVGLLL